jgi:hypothetical protein
VELDRRDKTTALNGSHAMATFTVREPRKCRIIRLLTTGPDHARDWYLIIGGFELYGDLRE